MKKADWFVSVAALLFLSFSLASPAAAQLNLGEGDTVRVVAIFAHPDDADSRMGGTAALLAEMGHAVKFVSLTNGDAGHQEEGGGALGKRRRAEAQEAARRLGIDEYVVYDNHDAELTPELHIRMDVIREIREWEADLVIGLRPNDYHPDHRNAGHLVRDASYMVQVPNVAPDTPPTPTNPVFLYMQDGFERPYPFQPDISIGIDEAIETKVDGLSAHESQMYEWLPWVGNYEDEVPEGEEERRAWLDERTRAGSEVGSTLPEEEVRESLATWYGPEQAQEFEYAESFEIAEYGYEPTDEEIRQLFPMLQME